ncbi:MAG TPA: MgtC/SapB family protein [Thermoanaerobaculia bacterium]|nr:MgtC/SapB family protein [Thermoanaerobaculia bacterium]
MSSFLDGRELELIALGRLCIAVLVGAIIGIERELADKPAGLRTHMLVAGSAALFVGLGDPLVAHWGERARSADPNVLGSLRVDPSRLLDALITGLAFLGAGTIMRQEAGARVSGLTTAASIFFTGIVGAAIAMGQYVLAVGSALVLLGTLRIVGLFERRFL